MTKRDNTELTREELLASNEMQPRFESIRMGQILKVRVAQLGGEKATWILESSDGNINHLRFYVCGRDWTMGENFRVTSSIEGRDMVCKIWEFEGPWGEADAAAEQKMRIDQKGCLRLKNLFPLFLHGKLMHLSTVFIARKI